MSLDPKLFQQASEAAERWPVMLADFAYWAEHGKWMAALGQLFELESEIRKHGPALEAALDQLATVGTVFRHHGIHQQVYNSAHEATLGIAEEAVRVLIYLPGLGNKKLPDDWQVIAEQQLARLWERFVISDAELSAGIRRERAKLRRQAEPKPDAENGDPPTKHPRESLKDDEYTILRALRDKRPRLVQMVVLSEDTRIARKTCGRVVRSLVERGLAERKSERSGATITSTGEAMLAAADGPLTAR